MNNEVLIYVNKSKLLLYSLIALGFSLGSGWILYSHYFNGNYVEAKVIVTCFIGLLFFGFGFCLFIKKLIDNKPVYILSDEGIHYYQSFKLKFLDWKHVSDIGETIINAAGTTQKFICINIKNDCHKESNVTKNFFDGSYKVEVNIKLVKGYDYKTFKELITSRFEKSREK